MRNSMLLNTMKANIKNERVTYEVHKIVLLLFFERLQWCAVKCDDDLFTQFSEKSKLYDAAFSALSLFAKNHMGAF